MIKNILGEIELVFNDGHVEKRELDIVEGRAFICKDSIPDNVDLINFMPTVFSAQAGEEGFLMIPSVEGSHHAAQTFFKDRPDMECIYPESSMPVYGFCKNGQAMLAVVSGMSFEYSLVTGVKDGTYYIYPRFILNCEKPYEDFEIRFFELSGKDASYVGMAKRYRQYQLERGACYTLKEREKEQPVLKKMVQGPMVRLRLAWKQVPSPVAEQTEENEPPIHIALTFKQVGEIVDEFYRQGIEHAEFCLVGWNRGGHDGRFPDLFPVEPGCGTEKELKELIGKTKSYGYLIVLHTCLVEGYSIAKRFNRENVLLNRDLTMKRGLNWGGGKAYYFCPQKAYDYFVEDVDNLKNFGLEGSHYLDVFSIKRPEPCYHPEHRLNRREVAEWRSKILALAKENFGASASEGGWDFCVKDLDYVLYPAYFLVEKDPKPLCDAFIPFWNIVYHGIQLYNCFAASVNACSKTDKNLSLRNYAWGGRPLSYFNSKFKDGVGTNEWGEEDIVYKYPEQLKETVAVIKADYDRYQEICDLQYEFIDDYEELPGNIYKTTFADGTVLTCDLTAKTMECQNK